MYVYIYIYILYTYTYTYIHTITHIYTTSHLIAGYNKLPRINSINSYVLAFEFYTILVSF